MSGVCGVAVAVVAPFTGAWIETVALSGGSVTVNVAPFTGAWIETDLRFDDVQRVASRPSRARGLKLLVGAVREPLRLSRPSRARGLKQGTARRGGNTAVAPFTGAWIETSPFRRAKAKRRRALHGRVD